MVYIVFLIVYGLYSFFFINVELKVKFLIFYI